jgi:multiple sugar transport system ATP-binding protein
LNRRPSQLSGGQRQRVAMGRALVREPQVFLFDEPLSNLDAKLRVDMRVEIKKLHQRLGATIVYVTHDQIEAMTMATKIAVMKGGIIQQFGAPKDIYDRPSNTFVATFMGSPAMNLLTGTIKKDGAMAGSSITAPRRLTVPRHVDVSACARGKRCCSAFAQKRCIWPPKSRTTSVSIRVGSSSARWMSPSPQALPRWPFLKSMAPEFHASLSGDADVEAGKSYQFKADLSKALLFDAMSEQRIAHVDETSAPEETRAA